MKSVWLFTFCIVALLTSACAKTSSNSGGSEVVAQSKTSSPKMGNIDLTIAGVSQNNDFSVLYEESFLNQPNFTVFQRDSRLSDLFDSKGASGLCFPSALAQSLIQLYAYHVPRETQLQLSGLNAGATSIDPSQLVRQLAALCKTDKVRGTSTENEILCTKNLLIDSGYTNSDVSMITSEPIANSMDLPVVPRAPTIEDIRHYLSAGYAVKIGIGWYTYNSATSSWKRTGGHAVTLVGYGYNQAWQDSEIILKVVNPNLLYAQNRRDINFGDTVTMVKNVEKPNITYPQASAYSIVGVGFGNNFVENILVFLPK